jgi:hypothetical protein
VATTGSKISESNTGEVRPTALPPMGSNGSDNDPGREPGNDPRPLGGYVVLMTVYALLVGLLVFLLRSRRGRLEPMRIKDLLLMGLATQHLSRLITKDSVLSPVRKPFTRLVEPAGEGEVNEEVVGNGLRHAIGELISCPFCAAQWVATGLVAGSVGAPEATRAGIAVLATAQVSDYLQLAYGVLRKFG